MQVERFVFRPHLADKARYYAVVFLAGLPLSHRSSEGGEALARRLVELYFTLFRMVVEGHIGAAAALRKKQVGQAYTLVQSIVRLFFFCARQVWPKAMQPPARKGMMSSSFSSLKS